MQQGSNKLLGYLHVLIQSINLQEQKDVKAQITLGEIAKVDTSQKKSGSAWNEVFLIEVPENPSRLAILCTSGKESVGECRYDVNPFLKHPGMAHSIQSDLYNDKNQSQGNIKLKLTFYSGQHGKLRIRVFHMSLIPPFVEKFKTGRVKAKLGIHVQSTPEQSLEKQFDHTMELVILMPTMNLTFEVVNAEGVLATYTIHNVEKSNVLQKQTKAYQVSLFNNDKAVGLIKYQVDWIRPE